MDTPRSDLAMWSGAPNTVPAPDFKTTRRGFEQSQVLEYIGHLTDRLQTVENLVRQLRSESDQAQQQRDTAIRERDAVVEQRNAALRERDQALTARPQAGTEPYEQVSTRVTELLVALDRDVEKMKADAEAEAEDILAHARSEAYRVQRESDEARTAAVLARKEAREEAERSLAQLTSHRDDMLQELRKTCSTFLEVISSLAASIEGGQEEGRPERTIVVPDVAPDAVPDRPA